MNGYGEPADFLRRTEPTQGEDLSEVADLAPHTVHKVIAQLLTQYEGLIPRVVERLLKIHEDEARLRRFVVKSDVYKSWFGIICALSIAMGSLFFAYQLILAGHDWAGVAIGTSIATVCFMFIYGTSANRSPLRQERQSTLDEGEYDQAE